MLCTNYSTHRWRNSAGCQGNVMWDDVCRDVCGVSVCMVVCKRILSPPSFLALPLHPLRSLLAFHFPLVLPSPLTPPPSLLLLTITSPLADDYLSSPGRLMWCYVWMSFAPQCKHEMPYVQVGGCVFLCLSVSLSSEYVCVCLSHPLHLNLL